MPTLEKPVADSAYNYMQTIQKYAGTENIAAFSPDFERNLPILTSTVKEVAELWGENPGSTSDIHSKLTEWAKQHGTESGGSFSPAEFIDAWGGALPLDRLSQYDDVTIAGVLLEAVQMVGQPGSHSFSPELQTALQREAQSIQEFHGLAEAAKRDLETINHYAAGGSPEVQELTRKYRDRHAQSGEIRDAIFQRLLNVN